MSEVWGEPINEEYEATVGFDNACPICGGTGEIWALLPDDVGSPYMTICDCQTPKYKTKMRSPKTRYAFIQDSKDVVGMHSVKHPKTPLTVAVRDVVEEYKQATKKFPPFNSPHEGYAIIEEELDELWDEVKGKSDPESRKTQKKRLRAEAVQVAAMAIRFVTDLTS